MSLFTSLKESCKEEWGQYINHEFLDLMSSGELDEKQFKKYLIQDKKFLQQYGRIFALLGFKSDTSEQFEFAIKTALTIIEDEIHMQNDLLGEECEVEEHINNIAYTRYLSYVGLKYDYLGLLVALTPCVVGYFEAGEQVVKKANMHNNKYSKWIKTYSSCEFKESTEKFINHLNSYESLVTEEKLLELKKIFKQVVILEKRFFDIGLEDS